MPRHTCGPAPNVRCAIEEALRWEPPPPLQHLRPEQRRRQRPARMVLGALLLQQGAPHDGAHDVLVDRRRDTLGIGQHRVALVVSEHRHPRHVDVRCQRLGDRVADHHAVFLPCLAQPLVHVLDRHQQPVLQLGRVELLQRGAVGHEAVTVSVSRPDRSSVPGIAPDATPSRHTSTPPTMTELIPCASATKRGAPAGKS